MDRDKIAIGIFYCLQPISSTDSANNQSLDRVVTIYIELYFIVVVIPREGLAGLYMVCQC